MVDGVLATSSAELRRLLFDGTILHLPASGAALRICDAVDGIVTASFGADPRAAETVLAPDTWFERTLEARARVAAIDWTPALFELVDALGLGTAASRIDVPRLRAVRSGGHDDVRAAPAYFAHRDTWYANPVAQVNVWIAMYDIGPGAGCEFFPSAFDRAVRNDSERFAFDTFEREGGFQAVTGSGARVYPRALDEAEWGAPVSFAMQRGECLLFSAAQLHRTAAHRIGRSRFSVDFRVVDDEDLRTGAGAPCVDVRCSGDASRTYRGRL